jgi:hypothetical protein
MDQGGVEELGESALLEALAAFMAEEVVAAGQPAPREPQVS